MKKEDRIKLLKIALSCLRKEGDDRPIFSPMCPTEKDIEVIKNSLINGDIDEKLLKSFFPMAYEGVSNNELLEYFFYVHNKLIRNLERYTKNKLFDWCTAYPAKIIGRKDNKWIVETIEGRTVIADAEGYDGIFSEMKLKEGDKIVLHREKISLVLNDEEFNKAVDYYNKFKG
jgi:hypothetical protein